MAVVVSVGEFEYKKKDLIGHGAFAVVFKGRRREDRNFPVAIKVITKKNLSKSQNLLTKEINILKGLKHENVVCLYDCKETTTHVNLVMEYCNGGDLADYLHAKGTLSEDTIRMFLKQIASAMKVLQSKGIVHRDLKPQNILLSHTGVARPRPADIKIKIADFGFARFLHGEMMAATLCGSPMYMAPEVIMSREYDAKADLWSLGTIVYQCLTGRAPFLASTPQELRKFYQKNKDVVPNIPGETSRDLQVLLCGMLKRNPKDRIEFREFFRHPFLGVAVSKRPSSPVQVPLRKSSPRSCSPRLSNSPNRDAPSDVRLDIFRRITPPYDMAHFSPPTYQYSPPMLDYSPTRTMYRSPPHDVVAEDDFVMVERNVPIVDQPEGHMFSNASDPLFPVFSTSPKSHKMDRSLSPHTAGSATRKATFIVGSPSSPGSPSSTSPLSRGSFANQSPSSCSPGSTSDVNKPTSRIASSPGLRSSPLSDRPPSSAPIPCASPLGARSRSENPRPCDDGYSKSAPIMVPHPRRSSFSKSFKSPAQVSPVHHSPTAPYLSPVHQSPANAPQPYPVSRTSPVSRTPIGCTYTSPDLPALETPLPLINNLYTGPSKENQPPTPTHHLPPEQQLGQPSTTNISPIVAAFSPYSPDKNRMGADISFASLLNNTTKPNLLNASPNTKPIPKVRSSPALSTPGAWALEAKSHPHKRISYPTSPAVATATNAIAYRQFYGHERVGEQRSIPVKSSLIPTVLSSSPLSSRENDDMKPLQGIFFGREMDTTEYSPGLVGAGRASLDGPITVNVPSLSNETLMEEEHVEAVERLRASLMYADVIIDVIQMKSTPLRSLCESMNVRQNESCIGGQVIFVNNEYKKAEQLALCVKVLRLLNTSLEFARKEIRLGRLKPSDTVKNLARDLNERNHECLKRAKDITQHMSHRINDIDERALTLSADKLIYQHALEICQIAALDELFGDAKQCKERYEKAALLLKTLEDGARSEQDKGLLQKYQTALNFRIATLDRRIGKPVASST